VAKAREAGLDPFLVRALVWRESKFRPDLPLGAAKERGLMQVTPVVGHAWAKAHKAEATFQDTDLQDPSMNLEVGCWYLKQALQHWKKNVDDPVPFALAEYNAGRSRMLPWVDPMNKGSHEAFEARINIQSTRSYIQEITAKRDEFEKQLADSPSYKVPDQPIQPLTSSPTALPTATPSH
jgi:soluble lytic murein transglycosylase